MSDVSMRAAIWAVTRLVSALWPVRHRASRARPYARPLPALRTMGRLPDQPTSRPVHGPERAPASLVRPYVLAEEHRQHRRHARLAETDQNRLGVAVLCDIGRCA